MPAREPSRVEQLLKVAAQLKKEKRYDEACSTLMEAFSIADEQVALSHRLRLPSYLLLAGRTDEAWCCLNELNVQFTEPEAQAAIASEMVEVLKKEGRFREALVHECWAYAMEVWPYRAFVDECIESADKEAIASETDEFAWLDAGRKATGKTPAGNPIYDCSYPSFKASLKKRLTVGAVTSSVGPLIRKFADAKAVGPFVKRFLMLLKASGRPDFVQVRSLVDELLGSI